MEDKISIIDCRILKELKRINVNVEEFKLVTCQENGIRDLAKDEIEIVNFWFSKITESFTDGQLVFRGQNKKNLIKILDKDYKQLTNEEKQYDIDHYLYHRLFFFGIKARWFYDNTPPHDFLCPEKIDCIHLFEGIRNKLSSDSDKLCDFKENNKDLLSFFSDANNKEHFCDVLLNNEKIYWYYSILLHRLGKVSSFPSQYLSSSLDIIISGDFSIHEKNKCPIIIMYILPNNQQGSIYSAIDVNFNLSEMQDIIQDNKLPFLTCWPYEEQQEITIAGCLFPHYMWAVIDTIEKRIVINPHILSEENKNNNNLHIEIDQDDFSEKLLRETSYTCGIFYNSISGVHEIIK